MHVFFFYIIRLLEGVSSEGFLLHSDISLGCGEFGFGEIFPYKDPSVCHERSVSRFWGLRIAQSHIALLIRCFNESSDETRTSREVRCALVVGRLYICGEGRQDGVSI
jgi:hypothetical protein